MSRSSKTYLVVGGGSGGHITPLLAVAEALKSQEACRVLYIGQRGDSMADVAKSPCIDQTHLISAGKFRRYHGESFLQHLVDVKTLLLNFRDLLRFKFGVLQMLWMFRSKRRRPDAIFLKGGFVSVPVGIAARLYRIPYITHDSDAIAGLANRITAKSARINATALPVEYYPYPSEKVRHVGVPIRAEFRPYTPKQRQATRQKLGFAPTDQIILSVGGGLGAKNINKALVTQATTLLEHNRRIAIVHVTGQKLYAETKADYESHVEYVLRKRVTLLDYTSELYDYSAVADVVITRAGATSIADFGAQKKACIVIPARFLTGGQQLHNAKVLREAEAAVIVEEEELATLSERVLALLHDEQWATSIAGKLHTLTKTDAAQELAACLSDIASPGAA